MILSIYNNEPLDETLGELGIKAALEKDKSVLIKINLARSPDPGHPRTDPVLLTKVIKYFVSNQASCAIAEGANGFLQQNLNQVGLEQVIKENNIRVIDLDLEDFDAVPIDNEEHYLPKCFREYAIRIGMPALSKRPEMIFSNNIKLFVGAVPRRMYQIDEPTSSTSIPRPRVHLNLHRSVANIYQAVMKYAPFHFFINGGKTMTEGQGEMELPEILIGNNALELDMHFLTHFNLEMPEYLQRLINADSVIQDINSVGNIA